MNEEYRPLRTININLFDQSQFYSGNERVSPEQHRRMFDILYPYAAANPHLFFGTSYNKNPTTVVYTGAPAPFDFAYNNYNPLNSFPSMFTNPNELPQNDALDLQLQQFIDRPFQLKFHNDNGTQTDTTDTLTNSSVRADFDNVLGTLMNNWPQWLPKSTTDTNHKKLIIDPMKTAKPEAKPQESVAEELLKEKPLRKVNFEEKETIKQQDADVQTHFCCICNKNDENQKTCTTNKKKRRRRRNLKRKSSSSLSNNESSDSR